MADAVVSAVMELILSVLKKQIQNKIQLVRGVDKELLDLSDKLKKLRNMLEDADRKQFKDKTVKDWLRRLEQTSYDMEDVLEEWSYALIQHKIESQSQTAAPPKQKVCTFIPSSCFSFKKLGVRRDIAKKVQNLKSRLDEILNEKVVHNFVISQPKKDALPASWRVKSDSSIDLTEIQGRKNDKDNLVRKLTANVGRDEGLGYQIISIVGAGGLGKTTLAQLVYNDSRVIECFDLKNWLCVSDPFDVSAIAKGIIESIQPQSSPYTNQPDVILKFLKELISGKKILLVLDDVWNEQEEKWKPLKNALKCGGAGSKILVTTRKVKVAKIMGTDDEDVHRPGLISDEQCWLVMRRTALSGKDEGEHEYFEKIGKEIAKKCNGLPLAAKMLGSVLHSKSTIQGWHNVLKSEMWELKQAEVELFPHLLLSYHELSPPLKHCFSYCAFFPKDEKIKVDELIRLWMALGYLGSNVGSGVEEMELKGQEYFEDLAMRSLFQNFERDDDTKQIVSCKMHDIVHDFAHFLRNNESEENLGFKDDRSCQVCDPLLVSRVKGYRSLFWDKETPPNMCECLAKLRVLRFKKRLNWIPKGMEIMIHLQWLDISGTELSKGDLQSICKLYFLQTLLLRACFIKEIPNEIGNLVQMRYLNLSDNIELKELTEGICSLLRLQTLNIARCRNLRGLPEGIGRLENLEHLLVEDNIGLKELPESICSLLRLQTLDIKSCKDLRGLPEGMGRLENLKHLLLEDNIGLKELPESICSLLRLQTLNITRCWNIRGLPEGIHRLENLKHLLVHGSPASHCFPQGVGELSSLRTLSPFCGGRRWNKLGLLNKLKSLTGSLALEINVGGHSHLEELVKDVAEAEVKNKIHLQTLKIKFNDESKGEEKPSSSSSSSSSSLWVDVLEALEPHHNLKTLEISGYKGWRLPHWISSPLNYVRSIELMDLGRVSSLPPMGKLPFLEFLALWGVEELKVLRAEWLGIRGSNQTHIPSSSSSSTNTSTTLVAFPQLKYLTFRVCKNLEELEDITEEEESAAIQLMPSLIKLYIYYCDKLKKLPHRLLRKAHSLQEVTIYSSLELEKIYRDREGSAWRSISQNNPQLHLLC